MKKPTIQQQLAVAQAKIRELEACAVHRHHFAKGDLVKMKKTNFELSAVIVSITSLSGKTIVEPIAIRGGLSPDTVDALIRDVQRSFEDAIELRP